MFVYCFASKHLANTSQDKQQVIKLRGQAHQIISPSAYQFVTAYTVPKIRITKLVGRFLKIGYFIGYFTAVSLKMYGPIKIRFWLA